MAKKAKAAVKPQPAPVSQDADWADGEGVEADGGEVAVVESSHKGEIREFKSKDKYDSETAVSDIQKRLQEAEARAEQAEGEAREAVDRMQALLEQVANGTSSVSLTQRVNEAAGRPKLGSLPSVSQPADKRKAGPAVPMVRLYCVPHRMTILIAEEEVEDGKDVKNRMVKVTKSKPVVWIFENHRCNVTAAAFDAAVDAGKYEYWGGTEWVSAPDLAEEIKRNTREGARFMERMYKKSVYANKSSTDSELQFAMEIHQELKSLGLL